MWLEYVNNEIVFHFLPCLFLGGWPEFILLSMTYMTTYFEHSLRKN